MVDMLRFFESGTPPVAAADTLAVMRLRDAILAADERPGSTVSL